jgi:hypothetical protein
MPTNTLPAAARTNPNAAANKERDTLAKFIVDDILNTEEDIDDDTKQRARRALREAGFTVYEEIRRD